MKDLLNLLDFDFHFPITDPTWIFFLVLVIILLACSYYPGKTAYSAHHRNDIGRSRYR